jgi:uncharacterized membrane protein YdjX (TVP38/TMEM64 family)
MIKKYLKSRIGRIIIGIVLGGVAGYFYYTYVGCNGGTCPITSSPWTTMLYFSLIGGLLFMSRKKDKKQNEDKNISSDERDS